MKVIKQDITEETSGLIIHGVNCQAVMGSGVALAIKTKWPSIYERYMQRGKGPYLLGTTDYVRIDDNLFIGNCYTQEFFGGKPGVKYATPEAVESALREAFNFASACSFELKMPLIASGLAGLSWDDEVKPIVEKLEAEFPEVSVTVFII